MDRPHEGITYEELLWILQRIEPELERDDFLAARDGLELASDEVMRFARMDDVSDAELAEHVLRLIRTGGRQPRGDSRVST